MNTQISIMNGWKFETRDNVPYLNGMRIVGDRVKMENTLPVYLAFISGLGAGALILMSLVVTGYTTIPVLIGG